MRAALLVFCGCMPPSVQAADDWLRAYAGDDAALMVERTWSGDRALVKAALAEREKEPSGAIAMLLPPKPVAYEIVEILDKETGDRHVVLAKVTMKNPLPFASERTGNALPDIPKTRTDERKLLAVREGDRWGVKLDLEAVKTRAEFAGRFFDALGRKEWDAARAMLRNVPPPPDDPNALKRKDRMVEELQKELEKRVRTSSVGG